MPVALELDIQERVLGQRGEDLGQGRDPRAAQVHRRQVRDRLVAALDAGQRVVMEQHRDAVPAQPDVELDAVDAVGARREDQRLERVLGRQSPVTAMSDPEHRRGGASAHPIRTVAAIPR